MPTRDDERLGEAGGAGARRVACARVREVPLAALARREPELWEAAVAVVDSAGAGARVVAVSPRALRAGACAGQTAHQARALVPGLCVRVADRGAMEAAQAALLDAAASVAPRVEPDGDRVYLDVSDVGALYGSEGGLCAALASAAGVVGLAVDVGVAGSRGVARVAASRRVGGAVVPAGAERAFLAPLPLDVLPLGSGLRAELARLGVRRVGELAALSPRSIGSRFGEEGARAVRLARGEDPTPVLARPHATRFEEFAELEWEVCDVTALSFVLKRLCDALGARLACRSLCAAGVTLALALTDRTLDERTVALAVPTRDPATMLHLLRAQLEARPPAEAVRGAKLSALAAPARPAQLGLFDPPAPPPDRVALTVARLTALLGEGRVGVPVAPDTHRPYAAAVGEFDPRPDPRPALGPAAPAGFERVAGVALHVFRPPRAAEVLVAGGRMVRVRAEGVAGAVRACCGPFRVAGEWWGEPFDHEGYDVELSDGGLYLVAFDRVAGAWRVDGAYD